MAAGSWLANGGRCAVDVQGGGAAEENHRDGFDGKLRSWFFPSQSARISLAGEIPSSLQLARISTGPTAAGEGRRVVVG
jgi:hypothetical protein